MDKTRLRGAGRVFYAAPERPAEAIPPLPTPRATSDSSPMARQGAPESRGSWPMRGLPGGVVHVEGDATVGEVESRGDNRSVGRGGLAESRRRLAHGEPQIPTFQPDTHVQT